MGDGSRRRRRAVATAGLAVVAGATVYLAFFGWTRGEPEGGPVGLPTVSVQRATLTTQELVAGTLGYGRGATSLTAPASGTVERLAGAGSIVRLGDVLYQLSGQPVVLLYGKRPASRTLVAGMFGRDVRQLNANLAALGYLEQADAGATFEATTETAVRKLQEATGGPVTGLLFAGAVVFAPGEVRIGAVSAAVGQNLTAGEQVLQIASAERVVSLDLDAARQGEVNVGDRVQVQLPDGQAAPGVVSHVSLVASVPAAAEGQPAPGGGADPAAGEGGAATIAVTVRLRNQRVAPGLDQAPVQVAITTATRRNALAVPVGALLAQPNGGYAVVVVRAGRATTVPVATGMFSDSTDLVEITEGDLRVGDRVQVPG